jgi:DNA-binding response OmpR family regulator
LPLRRKGAEMEPCKVLLVDDEEEFVSTLAERLRLRDIVAEVALNGEQALKAVEERPPHVVVLDVLLPGMGGLEVLRRIRDSHPQVQVILLTGRGSDEEARKGMALGAVDYLVKPVHLEELIAKIRKASPCQARETL